MAEKFGVRVRTIYRDIRALEDAGVPIYAADGKGYSLAEGYQILPVMFTSDHYNNIVAKDEENFLNRTKTVFLYSCEKSII